MLRRLLIALVLGLLLISFGASLSFAATKGYNEAPALTELVKQGKLPPVEKRLPDEPLVVNPVEEIGEYGGTWRMAMLGRADVMLLWRQIGYEGLVRIDPSLSKVLPNVAEKWEIGGGGTTFTFHLRKELKWSDGVPFTAEDVMFWYKDIFLNKELTPVPPKWLVSEGKPVKVEKVDNYTVKFTFTKPQGLFLPMLATRGDLFAPKHYMSEFHINYTPKEKLEPLIKKQQLAGWYALFQNMNDPWMNPDRPTINAWKLVTPVGAGPRVSFERNPYYWKVDPKGNQLPYIDRIAIDIVENIEVMKMKAMSGEIDMQSRHIGQIISDYPVYMENREKGGYRLLKQTHTSMNSMVLMFNLNHKDPVLRKLFNDKRFRIALSHAINREEIIELVYLGQSEPWQVCPRKESPYYYEPAAKNYIEYDVKKANQLLDELGLTRRDKDGFRLRPDGKALTITIEIGHMKDDWIDACNMITNYWKAVGVKAAVKTEDRSLWETRTSAGEHDATVWWGDSGSGYEPLILPVWYLPYNDGSRQAPQWGLWYASNGKSGEEPPSEVKKQLSLYDEILVTVDENKQRELFREILKINSENLYVMGICTIPAQFIIAKNNFRNVPENMFESGQYPTHGPYNPCQFFIRKK